MNERKSGMNAGSCTFWPSRWKFWTAARIAQHRPGVPVVESFGASTHRFDQGNVHPTRRSIRLLKR